MKVIKIKFEYGCFPVWIYGENNELIENDLPPYLIGDSDMYEIHAEKGIGDIKIDDVSVADNSTTGNGENKINIEGGVGSVDIKLHG